MNSDPDQHERLVYEDEKAQSQWERRAERIEPYGYMTRWERYQTGDPKPQTRWRRFIEKHLYRWEHLLIRLLNRSPF